MASRSPNYPNYDLMGALDLARKIYEKDGRNKVSKQTLAAHLGHEVLSGPALGKIGALRAYRLIAGTGDELQITTDALAALKAPEDSADRKGALLRLAFNPGIFQEIRKQYPSRPSREALIYWLESRGFSTAAAHIAASCYLATLSVVDGFEDEYPSGESEKATEESVASEKNNEKPVGYQSRKGEIMTGERELTTGMLSKTAGFRLLVSGQIGPKEIDLLIRKLQLDKEILAGIDFVDGSWHFLEFKSDMAEQEVARFASALKSKFNAAGMPEGCAVYRKPEGDSQLVFLNPKASRLVLEMPLWAHRLQSINVAPNPDMSAFKLMGIFN